MDASTERPPSVLAKLPRELVMMLGFAIAIFGVVATGGAICGVATNPSPWLTAAAYGGPASLAFGLYWIVTRRPNW